MEKYSGLDSQTVIFVEALKAIPKVAELLGGKVQKALEDRVGDLENLGKEVPEIRAKINERVSAALAPILKAGKWIDRTNLRIVLEALDELKRAIQGKSMEQTGEYHRYISSPQVEKGMKFLLGTIAQILGPTTAVFTAGDGNPRPPYFNKIHPEVDPETAEKFFERVSQILNEIKSITNIDFNIPVPAFQAV